MSYECGYVGKVYQKKSADESTEKRKECMRRRVYKKKCVEVKNT